MIKFLDSPPLWHRMKWVMDNRRTRPWLSQALLVAAVSTLVAGGSATTLRAEQGGLSPAALKRLTPEGYRVEKTIVYGANKAGEHDVVVALSGANDTQIEDLPVMLLLVAVGKKIVVKDRMIPHQTHSDKFWDGPPNYFDGMTKENVGGHDLILVSSTLSGLGSGSLHYKNSIYDAEKVCTRGEKHGKAFVYTCYLQVTKYAFDGETIQPVATERMREQHGNRFLGDKYWFISVRKALQKNEVFAQTP